MIGPYRLFGRYGPLHLDDFQVSFEYLQIGVDPIHYTLHSSLRFTIVLPLTLPSMIL